MKRLAISDDLLTGIKDIDNQHRELFARGNAVLFPEDEEPSFEEIINTLLFLLQYVDEHFSAEERMMKYYKYHRLESHRKQHQRLRREVKELSRRSIDKKTFGGIISELHYLLGDWYVFHIKEWDLDFAGFLQDRTDLDLVIIPGLEGVDDSDVKFL